MSTIFYKSVHLIRYSEDISIMGRRRGAISEIHEGLKKATKKVGLNNNV
jgi:hypothetical protein